MKQQYSKIIGQTCYRLIRHSQMTTATPKLAHLCQISFKNHYVVRELLTKSHMTVAVSAQCHLKIQLKSDNCIRQESAK